jgi:DNA-binding LytR/AlgR family response regulator
MNNIDLRLPYGPGWDRVPISSVQYIHSDLKHCTVVTVNRTYKIRATIRSFQRSLPATQFLRVHKSYIISLSYMSSFTRWEVSIAGQSLPVSRKALHELYSRFPAPWKARDQKKMMSYE